MKPVREQDAGEPRETLAEYHAQEWLTRHEFRLYVRALARLERLTGMKAEDLLETAERDALYVAARD